MERKIDRLGRIVIPKKIRAALGLETNSTLSVALTNGSIVLKPTGDCCLICKTHENINAELKLCNSCIQKIKKYI